MLCLPVVETGRKIVQIGSQLTKHILHQHPVPRRKLSKRGRSTMKAACGGHIRCLLRPARQVEIGGISAG